MAMSSLTRKVSALMDWAMLTILICVRDAVTFFLTGPLGSPMIYVVFTGHIQYAIHIIVRGRSVFYSVPEIQLDELLGPSL